MADPFKTRDDLTAEERAELVGEAFRKLALEKAASVAKPENEPKTRKKGRPPAREVLLDAVERNGIELAVSRDRAVARYGVKDHLECAWLPSAQFGRFLRVLAHNEGLPVSKNAIDEAVAGLEARAYAEGRAVRTFMRAGKPTVTTRDDRDDDSLLLNHVNAIVIDPGRPDWKQWLLAGNGPELIDTTDTRAAWMLRGPGFAALPDPEPDGSLEDLWRFVNVEPEDRLLVLAFMAHSLREDVAYAILIFYGEQGAAKTATQKGVKTFIDPNVAPVATLPRDPDAIFTIAQSCRVPTFDNVSTLSPECSDALCIMATGGARTSRKLYTDSEIAVTEAHNPAMLNGITESSTRGDLAERSILLNLPVIDPAARLSEGDLADMMRRYRGKIFGAFLARVDVTLFSLSSVEEEKRERGRLADFSDTGEALARSLGNPPGFFDALMAKNQKAANDVVLESSPLAGTVARLLDASGEITGKPSEILSRLGDLAGDREMRAPSWPKTSASLSNALRRIAPALRRSGIDVEIGRNHAGRYIRIYMVQQKEKSDTDRHADTPEMKIVESPAQKAEVVAEPIKKEKNFMERFSDTSEIERSVLLSVGNRPQGATARDVAQDLGGQETPCATMLSRLLGKGYLLSVGPGRYILRDGDAAATVSEPVSDTPLTDSEFAEFRRVAGL